MLLRLVIFLYLLAQGIARFLALPELLANSPTPGQRVAIGALNAELSEAGLELELVANVPTALQKAGQFRVILGSEIILCEAKEEATKKVKILERGAEKTVKAIHAAGVLVYHTPTAEGLKRFLSLAVVELGFEVSGTAVSGHLYRVNGKCELKIPEGTVVGEVITVVQDSPTGVCTIKPTLLGEIVAPGATSATIPLAGLGSYVTLQSIGGKEWVIVAGQLDSGWEAMALTAEGWGNFGGGNQVAQVRLRGDTVYIRGVIKSLKAFGLPATNNVLAKLPEGKRPKEAQYAGVAWIKDSAGSFSIIPVALAESGNISLDFGNVDIVGANNGSATYLLIPQCAFTIT